jgi:signal transduction histidine kinase
VTELDKVNILLVDDEPAKLLTYEVILSQLGENLIKVGSAREALEQLLRREIAVVLTDVSMPELDGFELAGMIREHPRFTRTAIIFVSAIHMTDPDRLRGYAAGAVDYLPVPIVPELMRAKVKVFADLHRKTRQLERLNAELEQRVAERTAQLENTNAMLEQRVEERTREREAALAQVHEMQKLESLGQLTGGVAHDFNNLLAAIMGNLELLGRRLPSDPRLTRLLDGAMTAANRGATLTRRLLAFARRQELKPEAVQVPALVDGMFDMLSRTLGPTVQVRTEFQPGLGPVRVDPNQLELALLNLALNARDAMPNGGSLVIGARRAPPGYARRHGLGDGVYVCVTVADSGVGMDAETLKHATEPFFTTKGTGKGTGLGLSMVHGLVAQSGGTIRIASMPSSGTTIELMLPVAETNAATASATPVVLPAASVPPCRVLLVDDDPLVLTGTTAMLEDLGHTVVETASAAQALDTLARDDRFDLVITDHAMPGMTGTALAQRVRQHWPDLPVVLATGYADLSGGMDTSLPRLNKPYRREELATSIAAALGPPAASAGLAYSRNGTQRA